MLERVWRKGNPSTLLGGMYIGAATVENSMELPQKTKNRVAIWFSNPTPGHISGENSNSKRYIHSYVHSSTVYNSQNMEAISVSTERWVNKEDVVHTYSGVILSYKKEWNMDRPRDYHTKPNKWDGERQILYAVTYMYNLKNNTSKSIYETETDIENKLMVTKGEKEGEGQMRSM